MKVTMISIVVGALSMVLKSLLKKLEELEIKRRTETIQNTTLNTLESFEDLKRLAVTLTPLKNCHLKLVWKLTSS